MEVVVANSCVSGVSHEAYNFTLPNKLSIRQAVRVTLKMCVIINQLLIDARLVDGRAAAIALEQTNNLAICYSINWGSQRCRYIDRIVYASFRTGIRKSVEQLLRSDACDGNDKFHLSSKSNLRRRIGGAWRTNCRWCG